MFNAYFLYFAPLAVAGVFLLGGITTLRSWAQGKSDPQGREYGFSALCRSIVLTLIGGGISVAILFNSPTPWQRSRLFTHIFHTPPEQILKLTLSGDKMHRPLVTSDIAISDHREIEEIARALSDATDIWPNHPIYDWTVLVRLTTTRDEFSFSVNATSNGNETIASVGSRPGGGLNLGDFRVDGLRPILERAAAANKAN
jgi:hypothetical protein